ncbi:MAG: WbqC family protein [Alistipes sp.]|nr:WbqC family protein [Alistipes sp.]
MTILPATYLGSVAYFARLLRDDCVIDLGEHFVKRSGRNRARILTANGTMDLTVQVAHADRPRTPMRAVRLDYSKRWQHQHWMSLVSGYRGSPYFDHYRDRLEPFYRRRFDFLADYDLELTRLLLEAFGGAMPRISESYVEASAGDLDLRPKNSEDPAFVAEPYVQVFSDRLPFAPNLSAADLLFAEGPGAAALLRRSLR